uniref:Uncharacterized protein n=1 Tax=Hyaloperonospora arabidopsidis (strain Emoy2) TaxID=559515 RepID=M4BCH6_HYAAE
MARPGLYDMPKSWMIHKLNRRTVYATSYRIALCHRAYTKCIGQVTRKPV